MRLTSVKSLLLRWVHNESGEYQSEFPIIFALFLMLLGFLYGALDWLFNLGL